MLPEWFNRIRTGQIKLPRFQRHEAWTHNEISSLLEAVVRGLPSGAALILEVGDREPFHSRTMVGAPPPTERVSEHLLDGQQRLTALWRSFHDLYDDRTYLVRLEDDVDHEGSQIWTVHGQARWRKGDQRYPMWVDEPRSLHERGYLPMRLLQPGEIYQETQDWTDAATADDPRAGRDLDRLISDLRERVITYNIPYLSLPVSTPNDVALEVFIKMNTSSIRLTAFDIVVAQLEEATGESLHNLVEGLRAKVPMVDRYRDPGNWVLDVAALREDHPPTQASYQRLDLERVHAEWDEIVAGIASAVSLLEEERIFDAERLPTVAVLPIIAALAEHLPTDPDHLGNARTLLRKYLWRSFLTSRYEQSVGTRSLQDYRGLRAALLGQPDVPIPVFDEEAHPLPQLEDLIRAGWPKRKEILARGLLAVSLRAGARDLADDALVSRENVVKREYHHLFPNSTLTTDAGLPSETSFRALNCALITWRTNRKISAKSPLTYLRERVEGNALGVSVVQERLRSHLIPYAELAGAGWDGVTDVAGREDAIRADYHRFLAARAAMMIEPIQDLCAGRAPLEKWLLKPVD
jgi:hypothetical protein